jgi:hypothetical protein
MRAVSGARRKAWQILGGVHVMDRSKYIARLMGPVMLVIGIGMALGLIIEGESYSSLLKEFIGSRALIFITGVLALLAGLAIVNAHNLWVRDWRVIVTILGWLLVLRGIMLLLFPAIVQTLGDRVVAATSGIVAGAAITFVIGAILSIMGYEDLWTEKKPRRSAARASSSVKRTRRKAA